MKNQIIKILLNYQNCNGHGKYFYYKKRNIFVFILMFFKFCDYCEGKIEDNKCIEDDK